MWLSEELWEIFNGEYLQKCYHIYMKDLHGEKLSTEEKKFLFHVPKRRTERTLKKGYKKNMWYYIRGND